MNRGSGARRIATGPGPRPDDSGQATVEIALLIPFVLFSLLAMVQVGFVIRARVMVTHAAREGVRVAAVGGSDDQVRRAVVVAADLPVHRVRVRVSRSGGTATVEVTYRDPTDVPLVGGLVDDVNLDAVAHMRIESG